jgi:hypothetical protein
MCSLFPNLTDAQKEFEKLVLTFAPSMPHKCFAFQVIKQQKNKRKKNKQLSKPKQTNKTNKQTNMNKNKQTKTKQNKTNNNKNKHEQ